MRRSARPYHEAMRKAPDARNREFQLPVELAELQDGDVVLDFPSGGGYLRQLIESSGKAAHYIPAENVTAYKECEADIVQCSDWLDVPLANGAVDVVLTIAAIHHLIEQRPDFYKEMYRLLRPGGRFVIADVAVNTAPALWLDEFVDKYSSEGHKARFLERRGETDALERAGFKLGSYEVAEYTWDFPGKRIAIDFCRGLFRLDRATDVEIWEGLQNYLGIDETAGVKMSWCLALIKSIKPG